MGVACSCSSAPDIVRYDAPALRPAVPSSWYLFAHVLFPLRENVRVGSIKYQTLLITICSCEFTSPCAYSISLRVGIEKKNTVPCSSKSCFVEPSSLFSFTRSNLLFL